MGLRGNYNELISDSALTLAVRGVTAAAAATSASFQIT